MKLRAENIALNCGFCKKSLQVPFCEEKSVQLVRVAFFRSDFLQNKYFKNQNICTINYSNLTRG